MSEYNLFRVPPTLITGKSVSELAGQEVKRLGKNRVFLVTDEVLVSMGVVEGVKRSVERENLPYEIFDQVKTEPEDEYVDTGLKLFEESKSDIIVAVGGGSPIDTAKAISIMMTNPGSIRDYMGTGKVQNPGIPLIAIPTTAGTGSEATQFTIITDTKRDVKMLIGSPFIIPTVALVDPLLTLEMPPSLTAATGIDALTHAIEAYVSVKAQPMSDAMALEAIKLLSLNLRRAWAYGKDIEARSNVLMGSLMAGIAFSNSSVALVHGMSRPMGAYFHIPHGVSNAILLGIVMEFSLEGNPSRYAKVASCMGEDISGLQDKDAAMKGAQTVKKLIADLNIPRLRDLGIDKQDLEKLTHQMAKDAIASGSPSNNPRQVTEEEIIKLYNLAY